MDLGLILISALQFTSVFLLVWSLFRHPVRAEPPLQRQIALALGLAHRSTIFDAPILGQFLGFGVMLARRFPFFRARIRADLEAGGNPNSYSVDEYMAICLTSGIGMGAVSLLFAASRQEADLVFLMVLLMPAFGFAVPLWSLRGAAARRMRLIGKKLPYTLDLVALLMEAGASFNEAVSTLIRDDPDDELNHELRLSLAEIDFGATRSTALANMAERVPLDSLRSVVGAINQAEALGTPLSQILKNQSTMIRMLRSVRAEEASASASTRILLPSTLILLAVVLIVFSPMIMRAIEGRLWSL
jgi:tight adherence protein C